MQRSGEQQCSERPGAGRRRLRMYVCGLLLSGAAVTMAQRAASQALTGDVHDGQGAPLAGIAVAIVTPGGEIASVTTSAGGAFRFDSVPAAAYTVRAVDARTKAHAELFVNGRSSEIGKPVHLVLAVPAAASMEFSDAPGFTIAGITDWTAVGGHGSDATLRTSEDLARETATLPADAKQTKRVDRAEQARLQAALTAAPQSYEANERLGEFLLSTGDARRAKPLLEKASALHGNAAGDEYALAQACEESGDDNEAERHLQSALQQDSRADFHRLAGEIQEHRGHPMQAVEEFQRAVAMEPSELNYFRWASELLLHRAVWQAATVFAKGVAMFPASTRLRTGWGAALFAEAKYDQASARLCEAAAQDPAKRDTYVLLGKAALAAPEPLPCAGERLAELLRMRPEDAEAHYYRAMLLLQAPATADQRDQAESMLRRAVQLDPKLAEALLELGILEAKQGNLPAAIHEYRDAVEAAPQLAEAHYRLGMALDRTGQHAEAKRELDLHASLLRAQAEAVEQQRREIKQFLVTLPATQATP